MIVQWLIEALVALIRAAFSVMPVWSISLPSLQGAGNVVANVGNLFNAYLPLGLMMVCLGVILAVQIAVMVWQFGFFVYHQFWGSS